MADDQVEQLLRQCKICIVCSKELNEDSAMQLDILIKDHGGEVAIHKAPAPFPPIHEFTHIISSTADFPAYQSACDALIPVVKPQWLQTSIARHKLANPRQFNPDPRFFFSDVVVTCGDIPEGDKDAIIGGVIAMGGLYSPRVTSQVTHLVDLSMDSDKAKTIVAKKLGTKIVLPHWFDDCLKLGRRIDERPYTLPNPEILRASPNAPIRKAENADIVGASTSNPTTLPTTKDQNRNLNVLEGKNVMLASNLGIGSHLLASIEDLIHQANGVVTKDLTKANMLICRYREGFEYRTASRWNKDVGNLSWLYHLITHNAWTSPLRRLLHYPIHRDGIPGFKGLQISLSNYAGEARAYLENLIQAAGAECTKTLRQENTHLITAHGGSDKCTAAKEWGVQIVNHLWLEESYTKWKMLPVSDPRYTHFPRRTNLGEVVGQTRLDRNVLEQIFFPAEASTDESRVMRQKDQNIAANLESNGMSPPKKQSKSAAQSPSVSTPKAVTPHTNKSARKTPLLADAKTPLGSRFLADGKENATPSTTSSRKSKEAAVARIHSAAPDIALYEKEKKRVGGVIYGGRRKNDADLVSINNKKRRSAEPEEDADAEDDKTDAKRQKASKPSVSIRLSITSYQKWVGNMKKEDSDKRKLRDLGIAVVQDAKKCTHLAAPSILRTPKFVNALAYAPVIVNVEYITQCLEKNKLLDPTDYILVDESTEKKVGFTLAAARERAKKNQNKLLRGYKICCLENIRGGFEAFKSIVEVNGGECTLFRGRVSIKDSRNRDSSSDIEDQNEDPSKEGDVFLLSGDESEHVKLWPRFRQMVFEVGKTPRIVNVNWLIDIAMSQEIRWKDEYEYTDEDGAN
ncbi:putative DNA repair protein Rtt107 [Talaromyces proteolyticus]|uniref:DNA repair protein Rtt107 n=1 Tax=Talaromyces proteolyticus TaxID=1131652 RepID=A0AAD4KUW6_9EURO|nr:putative DNA repair protein Rtt107 [Talaromyces proteolyticus]KAH8697495.1 putative DNA repair protein Rtt107 [Talaromyces proteolyticus]